MEVATLPAARALAVPAPNKTKPEENHERARKRTKEKKGAS
jgi:hypothetical protein